MTSRLILSADDYGMTPALNRAVWDLAERGILTATNIMANMPELADVPDFATRFPGVSLGVHVNLTHGAPLTPPEQVPSLVNETGVFYDKTTLARRALSGQLRAADLRREIGAQVERVRELADGRVDHWNSHQVIHRYVPIASAAFEVCRAAGIGGMRTLRRCPLRDPAHAPTLARRARFGVMEGYYRWLTGRARRRFVLPDGTLWIDHGGTLAILREMIRQELPHGVWELATHPATSTEGLSRTIMLEARVEEYSFLTSEQFRQWLESGQRPVRINFTDLIGSVDRHL